MCPTFGVYPAADAKNPGDEISSTYEGRHLTFLESELTHPSHTAEFGDELVNKGDPVVVGEGIVGVAFKSAVAATDLIAIDTEGIWVLDVDATSIDGDIAVVGGDRLFINTTSCVISKTEYPGNIPFGIALGAITVAGNIEAIAVKVHQDPPSDVVVIGGVHYFTSINVGGPALLGGGASVAGTIDLQTVVVHSSLGVAAGGELTLPQTTIATQLPLADPNVAGELWCNAGIVTRSAG